jgi:hypothetical protein
VDTDCDRAEEEVDDDEGEEEEDAAPMGAGAACLRSFSAARRCLGATLARRVALPSAPLLLLLSSSSPPAAKLQPGEAVITVLRFSPDACARTAAGGKISAGRCVCVCGWCRARMPSRTTRACSGGRGRCCRAPPAPAEDDGTDAPGTPPSSCACCRLSCSNASRSACRCSSRRPACRAAARRITASASATRGVGRCGMAEL